MEPPEYVRKEFVSEIDCLSPLQRKAIQCDAQSTGYTEIDNKEEGRNKANDMSNVFRNECMTCKYWSMFKVETPLS